MDGVLKVRHNIEVAHRLFELPGKCENIHGHSMWVTLNIPGMVNESGLLDGLDFSEVKREFRDYLDTEFDHRLLLNAADPFARNLHRQDSEGWVKLPGLNAINGDPTTENIAVMIRANMKRRLMRTVEVEVWETSVNGFSTW